MVISQDYALGLYLAIPRIDSKENLEPEAQKRNSSSIYRHATVIFSIVTLHKSGYPTMLTYTSCEAV